MTEEQINVCYWSAWKAYIQNRAHDGCPFTAIQIDSNGRLYRLEGGTLFKVDKIRKKKSV